MGNPGGDALGQPVRPALSPADLVDLLGEVGAYGVSFHDNDLIPIDATPAERRAILKEKVTQFAADAQIQGLLAEIQADDGAMDGFKGAYSTEQAAAIKAHPFDRVALGQRGMQYEKLDQLVNELLLGVR